MSDGALDVKTGLFSEYALDHCYDEMFDRSGVARPPYEALYRRLLELSPAELRPLVVSVDGERHALMESSSWSAAIWSSTTTSCT